MLRCDASTSMSFGGGFRKRDFFHMGRGFLPLLAVMLLATPQLAFAQPSQLVTVNPASLDIDEGKDGSYEVKLDSPPSDTVTVKVAGATANVTVDPASLDIDEGKGGSYKVFLDKPPSDKVTVKVAGATANVTVDTDLLIFKTGDTTGSKGRLVKVSTVKDLDAVSEVVTLTHMVTVGEDGEVSLSAATVTVTVTDNDKRGVTVNADSPLKVGEADSGTYTVELKTKPTATVTVDVGGTSGEITVSPSRLFFTPENWRTNKGEVTVYAGEDFDAEHDTTTLTHTVRGGDYTGESADTVSVMVKDNDERGVTVTGSKLHIAAGASGIYTVVLTSQPTRTVAITVTEDPESNDVSVSRTRLSFSTSNWNQPQEVTVRVDSDALSKFVTLKNEVDTASSSRDTGYDDVPVTDVKVDISKAKPSVSLSPSRLTIHEGTSEMYTVRLDSLPDANVKVSMDFPKDSDLTLDPTFLTFTTENYNTQQTVTVSAAEDADAVQDTATLVHTVGDAIVDDGILRVTIRDNDLRGVTVSPTSREVLEGATGSYSVVLDTQPTGNVTVTITGVEGDVTVIPSQLAFTNKNWNESQLVTIEVADDADAEPDSPVTLSHTVRGADYDRVGVDSVRVTIREKQTRGVTATPGFLNIDEGATKTYMVNLDSQPTGTVTVTVRGKSGDVTVTPSRLVFTTSTWDEPQTVTVSAGKDADAEEDAAVILTHAASGGGYDGVTADKVTVTTNENDTKGVTVTQHALTVDEGLAGRTYTVVLNTEPTGKVTITLGGLGDAAKESLEVAPTSLIFTPANWNVPQGVTVTASEDDDASGETLVTLTHEVNGGGYGDTKPLSVTVTIRDNDKAGVTVTPTSLEITQGSSRTYTVALNTKPSAAVTVNVSASGVTASPTELKFTTANWFQAQTVTVAAGDATSKSTTVTHSADSKDSEYGKISVGGVKVRVMSSDAPGVAVSPTSLKITEGGSGSYTVVLTKAPTATVTVEVSGATGDVRLSRTRLSFSTSNWNRDQAVTVSVSEDDDAAQDAAVTLTHTVTGAEEYENADKPLTISAVTVTLMENDTRGVTVTPTLLTIAAGVSGTYRVRLNTEPTDAVTVTVKNSPTKDVTVTGSPLIFTTDNWRTEQTVTVTVAEDAGDEQERSVTLTHTVTGGDYGGEHSAVYISSVTVTIPVEGAPGAPTGLSATGGDRSATLTWGAPADDGGSAIVRYQVRYQETGGSYSAWATVSGGAGATSTTVSGLENGTSYEIQVRAVNGISPGQAATASATLADSAPGAPANLTATGGDEQVALNWDAPADSGSQIIRYESRYAASGETWSEWATVSGGRSARSLTISGLTNGTLYGFRVRAVNGIGEGEASQATATPGTAPSAPMGLTARSESETITVMWGMPEDDGGSAITGYHVRYRMSGGAWSNWMAVAGGSSATSTSVSGLTNGIGHEIQVRAVNGVGNGAAATVEATPMEGINFAHFANGQSSGVTITSDIVLVNVETSTVTPAIYFYNQMGEMIDADSVVDVSGDLAVAGDGALTVPMGISGRGEITISTNGEGALVIGSVRVFGTGRLGGVLRFDIPAVGVAGVGASEPVNDAIFPARRMAGGINTGAAIRNLSAEAMTVTCMLMQSGEVMDTTMVELAGGGHSSRFIDEMFLGANTTDFVGSVRCTAADGGMFAGVALELDAANGIFTTLPVVPLNTGADSGDSMLNFAHFANGDFGGTATSSDLVFVNVATSAVAPAIYFYDQMGNMIDASMVVDAMMDGVDVASDGALMVMDEIPPMGEMTISTSGMGDGVVGSVRVVSDGPIGGVLRFDIPNIGVAGVGASEAVNAAIFPARRMMGGINTGAAIRNLESEATSVICRLMADGQRMGEAAIELAGNGQSSRFINEIFANANTDDFEGSVHCTAPAGRMFTGVALEMDFNKRIFTTLPVVPVK